MNPPRRLTEHLWSVMESLEADLQTRECGTAEGISLISIDAFNNLFTSPALILVSGDDQLRSALGLHLALATAARYKLPLDIFEPRQREVVSAARCLAWISSHSFGDLKSGHITERQMPGIASAAGHLSGLGISVFDENSDFTQVLASIGRAETRASYGMPAPRITDSVIAFPAFDSTESLQTYKRVVWADLTALHLDTLRNCTASQTWFARAAELQHEAVQTQTLVIATAFGGDYLPLLPDSIASFNGNPCQAMRNAAACTLRVRSRKVSATKHRISIAVINDQIEAEQTLNACVLPSGQIVVDEDIPSAHTNPNKQPAISRETAGLHFVPGWFD